MLTEICVLKYRVAFNFTDISQQKRENNNEEFVVEVIETMSK